MNLFFRRFTKTDYQIIDKDLSNEILYSSRFPEEIGIKIDSERLLKEPFPKKLENWEIVKFRLQGKI